MHRCQDLDRPNQPPRMRFEDIRPARCPRNAGQVSQLRTGLAPARCQIRGVQATYRDLRTLAAVATACLLGCGRPTDRPVETPEARLSAILIEHSELIDPFSTEFRDLRHHTDSTVEIWCGQLNSRNRMGAFVGWQSFAITVRPFRSGDLADSLRERFKGVREVEISMEPSPDSDDIHALMQAVWWRQASNRYCDKAMPVDTSDSSVLIRVSRDTIETLARRLADSAARAERRLQWRTYSDADKEMHVRSCIQVEGEDATKVRHCLVTVFSWPPGETQT